MKILLVTPDAGIHRLTVGSHRMSLREAPLTLTMLAALVPPELNASVRVVDESIQSIPWRECFDLLGISCLTGTALRGYALADHFRARGTTVVLGGIHVTLRPEEACRHADAIVVGFAEHTWPELLRDWSVGRMRPRYEGGEGGGTDLRRLPVPRRDLQKRFGYIVPNTVFATRGCRHSCEFCSVAAVPYGWQTRPVEDVIDEIRGMRGGRIAFNDVSLIDDREYARELFTAMISFRKKWGGLATIEVAEDDEMLDLMRRSGCVYLLIGFETLSEEGLAGMNKGFNHAPGYHEAMQKLHAHDLIVQGCFIVGLDQDDEDVFERTRDSVRELRIDIPRFAIFTPYPGTRAFSRLKAEGRILHEYWPHYDTQHVVHHPARMSPERLDAGFRWLYEQTFTLPNIRRRLSGSKQFPITFAGNLAYRLYLRRLRRDRHRIHRTGEREEVTCLA